MGFWSGATSLGAVTNAPWYVLQTNRPAGEYHFSAVATDLLGVASTSTVSTATVLSQPPTDAQALVTDALLVRQTGLFYQTVRVSNPTAAPLASSLFLVEFSTTAGRWYYVQYSSDMTNWKTALPAVLGNGSGVQWIDNGPPKTESLPSSESNRFYRVIL